MAHPKKTKQRDHYNSVMMILDVDDLREMEIHWTKMGMHMMMLPMARQRKRMRVEKSRSAKEGWSQMAMPKNETYSEIVGLKYGKGYNLRWREKGGMTRRKAA